MSRKRRQEEAPQRSGRMGKRARAKAIQRRTEAASQARAAERRRQQAFNDEMGKKLARS